MSDDAVRALLGELIDDAGLFPPARLPMAEALAAHESAAAGDAFWIANRFVVPASRLDELAEALDDSPAALNLSVIVDSPVADAAAFAAIARSGAALAGRSTVDALEFPFARLHGATFDDRCHELHASLAKAGFPEQPVVYVEVALAGDGGEEALLALRRARENGFEIFGKIRCGGLDAAAVPSAELVARFIWTANRLNVPFKATAGLHEALRHTDAALGTEAHGFLNLIGAALLARARGLDKATLVTMLKEREASAFTLDARRFAWREIGADAGEIGAARESFMHSYGSCSFEEPVRDLRALGILPQAAVSE